MRILMVSPIVGDNFGQERVMRDSTTLLRQAGHRVFWMGSTHAGNLPALDGLTLLPDLTNVCITSSRSFADRVRDTFLRSVAAIKPDVIHFIDLFDPRILAAAVEHYPTLLTAHTVAVTCPSSTRQVSQGLACTARSGFACLLRHRVQHCLSTYKSDLRRLKAIEEHRRQKAALLPKLKAVIAISQFVKSALLSDGWPEEKIRIVYNPILPSNRGTPPPDLPAPLLLCASRLVPHKGVDVAIDAVSRLSETRWVLWICGDGPERNRLERQVDEKRLRARVRFLGATSYDETRRLMASARAFIQANRGPEPFGLSVAEASLLGTPVVGSDIPALNEIVRHDENGLLAPPGNAIELTKALTRLLTDDALAHRLGQKGPESIRSRFSAEKHLADTLAVYSAAAAAAGGSNNFRASVVDEGAKTMMGKLSEESQ